MPRLHNSPIHVQVGLRGWAAIAAILAILIAVAVALAFLAVGFFIFVLPVMLIAPLFYYFLPKAKPVHPVGDSAEEELNLPTTIEGTFRVTDSSSPHERPTGVDSDSMDGF